MAKKKPKRRRAKTFLDRISAWAVIHHECATADPFFDVELMEMGRAAWTVFSHHRPKLSGLAKATCHSLCVMADWSCSMEMAANRKNLPGAPINVPAITAMIGAENMVHQLLSSLSVPDDEKYERDSDIFTLQCVHGAGRENITSVMGMLMLAQCALRHRQSTRKHAGYNAGYAMLQALDNRLKTGLTEI